MATVIRDPDCRPDGLCGRDDCAMGGCVIDAKIRAEMQASRLQRKITDDAPHKSHAVIVP